MGVATVSTLLEANKLARRALVWAQTPLRTFVHEEMSVVGWSDASWACRREGSSQGGYIVGVANKTFLEQAESPISVISWHSGKLARVARSSNSAELQAAADGVGKAFAVRHRRLPTAATGRWLPSFFLKAVSEALTIQETLGQKRSLRP